MNERYNEQNFNDLETELEQLTPKSTQVSAYQLIDKHYDPIRAAEQRGVPLQQIYGVLESKGLTIKFATFRNYLTDIKREKKKQARRAKRNTNKYPQVQIPAKCKPPNLSKVPPQTQTTAKRRPIDPSTVTPPPPLPRVTSVED